MRSIRVTSSALAACILLAVAPLPGCKEAPKPKPKPAAAAPADPEIQPEQLHGRWVIDSMNGGEIDRAMVETHELDFAPGQVRTHFVNGTRAPGTAAGGYYPWGISRSTLTVTNPSNGDRRSARISIDGNYLVIEAPNPFFVPAPEFQASTVAYKRPPKQP